MLKRLVYLVGTLGVVACATPSQPGTAGATPVIQVQTGREFDVAAGQEARVEGTPIVIRFQGVSNDSRCPADVQCVWAGNATVRFSVTRADGSSVESTLNTTLEPRVVTFDGFTLTLVALKPTPRAGKPVPAADYVATLQVTRG
ncbi:MAG TPA: hypothetical protein VHM24_06065 [Gemmatimonadaceae bacterium]|nr:hypothetical protein [Gemmatimonadaceae bacterium]